MSLKTDKILSYFGALNAIPRCSHNEAGVSKWLQAWAEERQWDHQCDTEGNLVVRVPASKGYEQIPVLVLQGHMDMVCEKTPSSSHDFAKDPIVSHMEGEWLTANDTTLGADNGIAIAYMMALADDPAVAHPPLELLFTVDEETGLNGAKALQPGFIKGRSFINIDSEDEGVFTVGCAGGADTTISKAFETDPLDAAMHVFELTVGGLKGGHSGIDIIKQRGNANKFLARVLTMVAQQVSIQMIAAHGGSRKNAIPRDAHARIALAASTDADGALAVVSQATAAIKKEHQLSDASLFITMNPAQQDQQHNSMLSRSDTLNVLDLLMALPDGVVGRSTQMPELVETSCNLATVALENGELSIVSSQRSAVISRLEEITAKVHAVAQLAGATSRDHDTYPPWQPDMASPLLGRAKAIYHQLFDRSPKIEVIHAGLECAIVGDIYQDMDMISLGPTIRNPHSPDEAIFIPSVVKVWDFLVALLAAR